jgi:hypothetical protein
VTHLPAKGNSITRFTKPGWDITENQQGMTQKKKKKKKEREGESHKEKVKKREIDHEDDAWIFILWRRDHP